MKKMALPLIVDIKTEGSEHANENFEYNPDNKNEENVKNYFDGECSDSDKLKSDNIFSYAKQSPSNNHIICGDTVNKNERMSENISDIEDFSTKGEENEDEHYSSDTDEYQYEEEKTCKKCSETFSNKKQLRIHMKVHRTPKSFICEICAKIFKRRAYLEFHLRDHSGQKNFTCNACEKQFTTYSGMVSHHRQHERERAQVVYARTKPFICDVCGDRFTANNSLKLHKQRIHLHLRPYVCTVCSHRFFSKSNLDHHMMKHTGVKPWICEECGVSLSRRSILKKHMLIKHNPEYKERAKQPYTGPKEACPVCGKLYKKNYLKQHIDSHDGARPYSCKQCGSCFRNASNLKNHLRIHSGEKPFFCDYCGKSFTAYNTMKDHTKRHTGDLPFKCESCSWAFPSKSKLKAHSKIHLVIKASKKVGRKPKNSLPCDFCEEMFSTKPELKEHVVQCAKAYQPRIAELNSINLFPREANLSVGEELFPFPSPNYSTMYSNDTEIKPSNDDTANHSLQINTNIEKLKPLTQIFTANNI